MSILFKTVYQTSSILRRMLAIPLFFTLTTSCFALTDSSFDIKKNNNVWVLSLDGKPTSGSGNRAYGCKKTTTDDYECWAFNSNQCYKRSISKSGTLGDWALQPVTTCNPEKRSPQLDYAMDIWDSLDVVKKGCPFPGGLCFDGSDVKLEIKKSARGYDYYYNNKKLDGWGIRGAGCKKLVYGGYQCWAFNDDHCWKRDISKAGSLRSWYILSKNICNPAKRSPQLDYAMDMWDSLEIRDGCPLANAACTKDAKVDLTTTKDGNLWRLALNGTALKDGYAELAMGCKELSNGSYECWAFNKLSCWKRKVSKTGSLYSWYMLDPSVCAVEGTKAAYKFAECQWAQLKKVKSAACLTGTSCPGLDDHPCASLEDDSCAGCTSQRGSGRRVGREAD